MSFAGSIAPFIAPGSAIGFDSTGVFPLFGSFSSCWARGLDASASPALASGDAGSPSRVTLASSEEAPPSAAEGETVSVLVHPAMHAKKAKRTRAGQAK